MTAIFVRQGHLFGATEHAGGPWSPDMLQGSATTALMAREVERLAANSGFAVRRLTFDLWRPAGLRAFRTETDTLRDGRKAKTLQVRLIDGEAEIGRCTALLTAPGNSPADPFSKAESDDAAPETGTPPPAFAQKWSRYFQNVSVRLIEGALERESVPVIMRAAHLAVNRRLSSAASSASAQRSDRRPGKTFRAPAPTA